MADIESNPALLDKFLFCKMALALGLPLRTALSDGKNTPTLTEAADTGSRNIDASTLKQVLMEQVPASFGGLGHQNGCSLISELPRPTPPRIDGDAANTNVVVGGDYRMPANGLVSVPRGNTVRKKPVSKR